MKVLITGATGLIGREVGKRLASAGHKITVVSRDPVRAKEVLPFPARVELWAGHFCPFPAEALSGQEAIVNLAGEPIASSRWTEAKKKSIRDSRVIGTRRLVEGLLNLPERELALKVFVQGSAVGYYGDRCDDLLTEESAPGGDFLAQVVVDWEQEASVLSDSAKTAAARLCVVRTGVVLSRRDGALTKMLPIFTKGLGGKLGTGQQWMSWIHCDDIARLFVHCVEKDSVSGVINGVSAEPCRNERFTLELARALGRSVFLPVPEAALKVMMGEMAAAVLSSQRVSSARLQGLGFDLHYPGLIDALENLGAALRHCRHELVAEQWLPVNPQEVFPFFSNETNLESITPPSLNFQVLGKSTQNIGCGTRIDYKMSLHGLPMKWRTKIEEWKPGERFIDTQEKGPYQEWKHVHEFIPLGGGTLLRDHVVYKLPFGWLGDAVAGWMVSRDVRSIFNYRRRKIVEKFVE